ncbi:beta-galactosidase small subunit-related protein [Streptomyces eurythermus]
MAEGTPALGRTPPRPDGRAKVTGRRRRLTACRRWRPPGRSSYRGPGQRTVLATPGKTSWRHKSSWGAAVPGPRSRGRGRATGRCGSGLGHGDRPGCRARRVGPHGHRPAAAGSSSGLGVVYRRTACGTLNEGQVRLRLESVVTPDGPRSRLLPRPGVAMSLPSTDAEVEWFGSGPGEAYRDSRAAARVGRHLSTVSAMQIPQVRPRENGNRRQVVSPAGCRAGWGRGVGRAVRPTPRPAGRS